MLLHYYTVEVDESFEKSEAERDVSDTRLTVVQSANSSFAKEGAGPVNLLDFAM